MRTVTIGRKTLAHIKTGCATGNAVEHRTGQARPQYLRHYEGHTLAALKTAARPQADGHRWVQVATGNMANGIGHGDHSQTKGQ